MARAKPITTAERLNVSVKKITSDLGVNFKNVLIQILKKIVRKPKTMLGAGGHWIITLVSTLVVVRPVHPIRVKTMERARHTYPDG